MAGFRASEPSTGGSGCAVGPDGQWVVVMEKIGWEDFITVIDARDHRGSREVVALADLSDEEFEAHMIQRQDVVYNLTRLSLDRTMRFFATIPVKE